MKTYYSYGFKYVLRKFNFGIHRWIIITLGNMKLDLKIKTISVNLSCDHFRKCWNFEKGNFNVDLH